MKRIFSHIYRIRRPLQLALVFFLVSLLLDTFFASDKYNQLIFRRFQDRFVREQNELELRLDRLSESLKSEKINEIFSSKIKEFKDLSSQRNISMYVYRNDSLVLWSDNKILETDILPAIVSEQKLVHLSNGWYYSVSRRINNYTIVGLLLVKNNYVLQNKFLQNNFNPIFSLPKEVKVKTNTFHEKYVIKSINGYDSFALVFTRPMPLKAVNYFLIIVSFVLSLFFLINAFSKLLHFREKRKYKFLNIIVFIGLLFFFHFLMMKFRFPDFLYRLDVFRPFLTDGFLKYISPGDLAILSGIIYILVYFSYTRIHLRWSRPLQNTFRFEFIKLVSLTLLIAFFLFVNELFKIIVFHSSLNFESFALSGIDASTLFGIIAIALLFAVFVFIADYIYKTFFSSVNLTNALLTTLGVCILVFLFYFFWKGHALWGPAIVLGISLSIVIFMRKIWQTGFRYKHILMLIIAFSSYSVYVFFFVSSGRQEKEKREMAVTLSTEHDIVAEYLISENGNRIQYDSTIRRMTLQRAIDYPWLFKYIRKKYFSGYWDRYDMQITICRPEDSVFIQPELTYQPCFNFFDSLVTNHAERLPGTSFYYLKNSNGRISYFTHINFYSLDEKAGLFIQLDSRLNVEDIGYPELLLDQQLQMRKLHGKYSYAKYFRGKLSYQSGNFLYNVSSLKYPDSDSAFFTSSFGGYDHLFYKSNQENLIVLSKPSIRFFDLIVSFSYLFVFYFLLLNVMLLSASPQLLKPQRLNGFKNRIRVSVIGVLLLSLIAVAGTTSYFITEQYRMRHLEVMRDKLQSVYLELENILAHENKLHYNWKSEEYNNLEELLRRLSNIFFTDINLYDQNGQMIASSRTEIFNKGISGTRMNPNAYFQLSGNNKAEFRQNEHLGNLQYTSIYTTLVNGQNQFLAYLNLPYFTRQSQVVNEISSMMYAIVNFYLIFILISISIAVFISEKVVHPLKVVQQRFSRIRLGAKNEKIEYSSNDEIGGLVEEYNRMVDELEKSVELLSKSEREIAWREMARQVAHEIKNPLTPMKLSIQQLQRAWNDKHENLDDYLNKVSKTLIEQIENLSAIATEFSNFAKMPKFKPAFLDLKDLLHSTKQLFSESNVEIKLHYNDQESYVVFSDKDQLSRVVINLITNAIQAIPEDRKGKIDIVLEKKEKVLILEIEDNGKGIPEEMIEKMFQPNFTTKSGGMGLGLAISKNIIDNMGGSIDFQTKPNKGTNFKITLPRREY